MVPGKFGFRPLASRATILEDPPRRLVEAPNRIRQSDHIIGRNDQPIDFVADNITCLKGGNLSQSGRACLIDTLRASFASGGKNVNVRLTKHLVYTTKETNHLDRRVLELRQRRLDILTDGSNERKLRMRKR